MSNIDLKSLFPDAIDPNSINIFEGRIVNIPDSFPDDGILYVDITDPNDSNLENGKKRAYQARSSNILLNYYNAWDSPPEIKFKSKFNGSMSATTSGDFHLRNYCFDMMTQTWFMTVSTALNALGIVNIPPVMVSLDTTPFPGKAVAVNIAPTAEEVVNKSLNNVLRGLETDKDTSGSISIPTKEDIKSALAKKTRARSVMRSKSSASDAITNAMKEIAQLISNKLGDIIEDILKVYVKFFICIDKIFQIYKKYVNNSSFPITQYANILSNGEVELPDPEKMEELKSGINDKLEEFNKFSRELKAKITSNIDTLINDKIVDLIYEPIATLFSTIESTLSSIIDPIKEKLVTVINSSIKEPLSKLTSLLANAVQPIISSLPTIVQIVVKIAIDKLLTVILGKPIEFLLKTIVDPVIGMIDKAVDVIMGKITDIISMAFGTLIRPLIDLIAYGLEKLVIPTDFVGKFESLLDDYLNGTRELPKFSITNELINSTGDLVSNTVSEQVKVSIQDLNFSDPAHIRVFLKTLFSIVDDGISSHLDYPIARNVLNDENKEISTFVIKENDIYGANTDKPYTNGSLGEFNYEEFTSKSIMDLFLQRFEEVLVDVKVSDFKLSTTIGGSTGDDVKPDLEIKTWQTNNYKYTEFNGELYLIGGNSELLGNDGNKHEVENGLLYVATKIAHISTVGDSLEKYLVFDTVNQENNDTNIGEDLVLDISEDGNVKKFQKLKKKDGKKLYKYRSNKSFRESYKIKTDSNEYTFEDIIEKYFAPWREKAVTEIGVINECNLKNSNEFNSESTSFIWLRDNSSAFVNWNKSSCYFKRILLKEDNWKNNIFSTSEHSNLTPEIFNFNTVMFYKVFADNEGVYDYEKAVRMSVSDDDYIDQFYSIMCITNSTVFEYECLLYDGKKNFYFAKYKIDGIVKKLFIYSKNSGSSDNVNIKIVPISRLKSPKTFSKKFKDVSSGKYFSWTQRVNQNLVFTDYGKSTVLNRETKENSVDQSNDLDKYDKLIDIFSKVMNVIGQDSDLNLDIVFGSQMNNMLEPLGQLSTSVSSLDSVMSPVLETVDELKDISNVANKVAEVASKVGDIADSAGPVLEATAKAASAVAIQSCSMSQSAKGKDFSFSSGENYSLSTISEQKSQLPYCKTISKDSLLNVGDKCMVLGIGGGKGNLVVIDII